MPLCPYQDPAPPPTTSYSSSNLRIVVQSSIHFTQSAQRFHFKQRSLWTPLCSTGQSFLQVVPLSHRPTVLIIIPLCLSSIPIPSAHSHFHLRFGCVTWPSRILVTAFTLIKAKNVGLYTGSSRPDPVPQRHNSIFGHQFNCDGVCCAHLIPLSASSSSSSPPPLLQSFWAASTLSSRLGPCPGPG